MSILPDELVRHCVSFLTLLPFRCLYQRVCKSWRRALQVQKQEQYAIIHDQNDCVNDQDLQHVTNHDKMHCYTIIEPSMKIGLIQSLIYMLQIRKLTTAGCTFTYVIADMSSKSSNDFDVDQACEYTIQALKSTGILDLERVQFIRMSKLINSNPSEYWPLVLDISCKYSLISITKLANSESSCEILHACMKCAIGIFLDADICFCTTEDHLELFVRDYCILKGRSPMVVLSPYTSASLQMSKMLMSDAPHEIDKRIRIMYCPPQYIHGNPIIDIARRIIFPMFGKLVISSIYHEPMEFETYDQFEKAYKEQIHPGDIKKSMAALFRAYSKKITKRVTVQ
jgi:tyrosyl-tRNA synthetase